MNQTRVRRRTAVGMLAAVALPGVARALMVERPGQLPASVLLDSRQSEHFRAWMTFIVAQQFRQGPSQRWFHRDCAGLVRYAVAEAFRTHDANWRKANGLSGQRLPPEVVLRADQGELVRGWTGLDGNRQAFVTALGLVQGNSRPLGKASAMARPGDLLFFDQGDEQHLMVWMGSWVAYHNGQTPVVLAPRGKKPVRGAAPEYEDSGLRAVTPAELMQWKDTRWRPHEDNPNFAGYYRLGFLTR